jgi:hypothetical protein
MRIGPCPKYVVLPFGLVQDRTGNRAGDWYVSSTNRLLIAPVHVFTKCARGAYTGARFYRLCLDQSEIPLKDGRAQDVYLFVTYTAAEPKPQLPIRLKHFK